MNKVLLQAWQRIVQSKGRETAITVFPGGRKLSYQEIEDAANHCFEKHLSTFPNPASTIIALQVENRENWLIRFLAILKAGCVALPVDTTSVPEEVQRLLAFTGANAWFHEDTYLPLSTRVHSALNRAGIQLFKVTSGSTSNPKVIPFTEDQMVADAQNILETMGIGSDDIQFVTIPLGHSYGLGSLIYPFFLQGIPLVFNSIPLPGIISRELFTSQATVMPTIPAILKALAHSDTTRLPPSLRLVISAASALSQDLVHDFHARHALYIHNFYGSSETGGIAYDTTGSLLTTETGAVGVPLKNVHVTISKTGRVRVNSKAVTTHRNRQKENGVGSYLLSDFGTLNNSALVLRGRSNRIVKHNGKRLDLSQIEKTLAEHPGIQEAFVAYDEDRHRVIAAVAGKIEPDGFMRFASDLLPVWKRPKLLWVTPSLPTTARGKPDKVQIFKNINALGLKLQYPGQSASISSHSG